MCVGRTPGSGVRHAVAPPVDEPYFGLWSLPPQAPLVPRLMKRFLGLRFCRVPRNMLSRLGCVNAWERKKLTTGKLGLQVQRVDS